MKGYGGGPSTGAVHENPAPPLSGLTPADAFISPVDRDTLRRLASRVAIHAQSPAAEEKRRLWRALNGLHPPRPLVLCDPEQGWNEIVTAAEMACAGALARRFEMHLRQEIFWQEEMGDDKPLDPFFDVAHCVIPESWGVSTTFRRSEEQGAQTWEGPVQDYDRDLVRVRYSLPRVDREMTAACLVAAEATFAGILPVRLRSAWWWSLGVTLPAVYLRGLTNLLYDFAERPDELKALLAIVARAHHEKIDWLEREGLLSRNTGSDYVGSGGYGNTDELPGPGNGPVQARHLWGFCESQESVGVSPRMYEEFIFPLEQPIMERFGLTCYGCCEPLHPRWHIVKRHPHLRRVSCSPWADLGKMAANLGRDYILSMKPSPSPLARPAPDFDAIRRDLRRALEVTRGCVVEIIMKDNHTLGGRPENATEWCRMAREESERTAGMGA